MAFPGEGILTDLTRRLVDKTMKEVSYFRHFETHVREFEQDLQLLEIKLKEVQKDIQDAKRNNHDQIKGEVQFWIKGANNLIQNKAEIVSTRFDSCCLVRQYRQGKRLAQRRLTIQNHIQKCEFEIVARPAELLYKKYHVSRDFIDFESRKRKFKELMEALEDGNHYMIGLQGMGGTGKTTLARLVGQKLEESKSFEIIFVVVSNPPDVNKIQGDIARQLGLKLEERVEAVHSELLWSRISENEKKLLIILDDVWGQLNLTEIGIPSGLDHKNCYVLITTRDSKVCQVMRCQQIVRLHTLDDEDALCLFRFHAKSDNDDSLRKELEGLARNFLKECGGLPVTIVALARALRNWPVGELNMALTALQNSKSLIDVDEDLLEVYSCLKYSYDYLHNEKAQNLLLLCSIFPEDYEFPINLVIRLGIGSGIFEEADDYCAARSQALAVKNKLIDSSLLHKVEEKECVKMHDLVREVAQWIAKEDIQVIKDSRITLKTNKRFVFWSTNDFPDQFDDTSLEILLLWISGNVLVKDPNVFFAGMSRLKILFLLGDYGRKVPTLSLPKSLLSLKDIRTLILDGWALGDISVLKNIQSLVTLEFKNCLIMELPRNVRELKKLRWLGMRKCEIQKDNPFEVIEKCSQLEEVYFVENFNVEDWNTEDDKENEDEIAKDISPVELQIFSIAYNGFQRFYGDDNGLLKCFNPENIKHLIPDAMFKYLVRSAEVLELGKIGQTGWKNLAPDIIPLENEGMDNLIKLYLYEWDDIECLIDHSKYHYSNTTFFSKLVELHLYCVGVKKLYSGAMPSLFLWQLQILKLEKCMKLENIFFDENIKLPYLKVLRLIHCPMFQPSIFQYSVAQSLERLEELEVEQCDELKSLIAYESLKQEMIVVSSQKNYGLLFPALKSLTIGQCGKLEMVFSLLQPGDLPKLKALEIWSCEELKYIFGEYRVVGQVLQQEIILPLLTKVLLVDVPSFISIVQSCQKCVVRPPQVFKEDLNEKHENSKASAFSWAYGCCFLAPTKDTNIGVSNATIEQHTISQGSSGSSKRMEILHTAECIMRHPLSLQNIREMRLGGCSKLKFLFSASIAATIMLETLTIRQCEELKHIITNEPDDDDHFNCTSIFPKLQSLNIYHCNKLEFIFPSTLSGGLQKLKSIDIFHAHELKYVFGKYNEEEFLSNENKNHDGPHIDFLALESLILWHVPNMISIGIKKYQQKCPSLQVVEAPKAPTRDTNIGVPNATVKHHTISQEIKKHMQDVTSERAKESELQEIVNVETPLTPSVAFQYFLNFHNLKEIYISINKKLKTLFSVSACRNLPQLSQLTIGECEELVNVVEDDSHNHHHMNSSSIFPKLEDLSIFNCNKLEFIFPLCLCGSLQKLKSTSINEEECVLNENESNEPHIHLPTLETLILIGVPNMISIGVKKYQQKYPSIQIVEAPEATTKDTNIGVPNVTVKHHTISQEIKKHVQDETSERAKESEPQEIVNVETPLTPTVGFQYFLNFRNLKQIQIWGNKKWKTLFSISACRNLPQLSKLTIGECEELVNVVEDDSHNHHHMNSSSIFPKLEYLSIFNCNKLEFIYPLSLFGSLQKLKSLIINEAAELNCIFGNESDELHIHLPATLERLSFLGIPKIMNKILAKKYHVSFMSLQSITLGDLQEFNGRSFLDLMAYVQEMQLNEDLMKIIKNVQKLTYLEVKDSKVEEVLNLEGVEIEGTILTLSLEEMWLNDLSELNHICKGPKHILRLPNLRRLNIIACKKLRVIFSVSIVKSFPQLSYLNIKDCNELIDIIEESVEGNLHQICFPELETFSIDRCNSLKCLFSISTCGKFPKLWLFEIKEASKLEQVFVHKQDDMLKKTMRDEVFPKLSIVELRKLPMLITICEGIDFQTLEDCEFKVDGCPKYQGIDHIQEGSEDRDSENQTATNSKLDFAESKKETVKENKAKDPTPALLEKPALEGSTTKPQLRSISLHNYKETEKEGGRVVPDPTSKLTAPTSSSFQSIDATLKERAEESSTSEDVVAATMVADVVPRNSWSVTSSVVSQVEGSKSGSSTLSIKDTKEHSHEENFAEEYSYSKKQSIRPIDNLPIKDSAPELEDEQKTIESTTQFQHEDLAETKPTTEGSHKINAPLGDNVLLQNVTSSVVSQVGGLQSDPSTLAYKETEKEVGKAIPASSLPTTASHDFEVASMKEKHEQAFQGDDATRQAAIEIQPTDSESMKQTRLSSIIAQSVTSSVVSQVEGSKSSPSTLVSLSAKETTKGIDENATATYKSPMAIPFMRALTIKEIGDHSSIQEEAESEKPTKATLPQVIPSLHYESQTGAAGSSSPILEIGEIFQLVELKDGEPALLAKALELYPQLRLSRGQRTHPIIAFSYRVLVDILVMLATKTPYTLTASDRTTLEENLGAATFFGFDKDWIESVRAKVFGIDKSEVLTAEGKISVMEEELGKCDIALERMQKKRIEAREKLAIVQNEFEAVDAQLFDLLENRRNLVMKMTEFRKTTSVKDMPFGI